MDRSSQMIGWLVSGVAGLMLLSGCDSRQPTIREGTAARQIETEQPQADAGANPHGLGSPPGRPAQGGPLQGAAIEGVREIQVGRMQLVAPEDWTRKSPRSGFVLAEFSLPRADGDAEDARLTISAVGGGVDQNIARWRGQFGGKVENESVEKIEVAGVKITLVDLSGAYRGMHGGIGAAEEQPSHRMLAAIYEMPTRQHVVKCTGPGNTIAKHADAFETFARSLSSRDGAPSKPETVEPAPAEVKPAVQDAVEEKPADETQAEGKPAAESAGEETAEEEPIDNESAAEEPSEDDVSDEKAAETESR